MAFLLIISAPGYLLVRGASGAFENIDSVGLVDTATGTWHMSDSAGDISSFYYGDAGDVPLVGDWNCDGIDTVGVYRPRSGVVFLRNSNTPGIADFVYALGNPGDIPLAGDFNGDCYDTVSLYRPSEARFYILNQLRTGGRGVGAADFSFEFGDMGDVPFVGDFDGDQIHEVAVHRPTSGLIYYRETLTAGQAHKNFEFGVDGDVFVAGDWNKDG
ncbi:MAG: hypothetical protein OEM22_07620, partial [Acidimicrobiia bacterium]|nr:hypothetical protein [Acidimicrobiia bacterium]